MYSVNRSKCEDKSLYVGKHIDCDFLTIRGFKDSQFGECFERHFRRKHTIYVILDHSWLQCGYYATNYGTDWLSKKAQLLFGFGISKLFLPNDTGGEMVQMHNNYRESQSNNLNIAYCPSDDDNPFFKATSLYLSCLNEKLADLTHISCNINNYTVKNNRFLLITNPYVSISPPVLELHQDSGDESSEVEECQILSVNVGTKTYPGNNIVDDICALRKKVKYFKRGTSNCFERWIILREIKCSFGAQKKSKRISRCAIWLDSTPLPFGNEFYKTEWGYDTANDWVGFKIMHVRIFPPRDNSFTIQGSLSSIDLRRVAKSSNCDTSWC